MQPHCKLAQNPHPLVWDCDPPSPLCCCHRPTISAIIHPQYVPVGEPWCPRRCVHHCHHWHHSPLPITPSLVTGQRVRVGLRQPSPAPCVIVVITPLPHQQLEFYYYYLSRTYYNVVTKRLTGRGFNRFEHFSTYNSWIGKGTSVLETVGMV
jgi:hypothetical protein